MISLELPDQSKNLKVTIPFTEFLMIGAKQQLAKVNIDHILIGNCVIRPKGVVKNLGTCK